MKHLSIFLLCILAACGGGGGGSSSVGGNPVTPATVSGDMLALSASRGWNYQTTNAPGGNFTVSLYSDPTPVNGITALVGAAVQGLVPTVLTSAAAVNNDLVGVLGLIPSGNGYSVASEISAGSTGAVPGTPLFVANTLTQGQVTNPYPGVTETVLSVGTMPNANACPAPTPGATVQYNFNGGNYAISFVPGCGITQLLFPSGTVYNLISVGSYSFIGQLSAARRVESATLIDTARSLLGLERNNFAQPLKGML